MVRNITWTISNLCRGKKPQPNFELLKEAVPMMCVHNKLCAI